jgi:putative transport protein
VGLIAGPSFFRNLKKNAMSYGAIALAAVTSGAVVTVALQKAFSIPPALAAGIYAGAMTTTPGLAAALEATGDSAVSIGYGIAYPFGVVGVVLFVQALPRLLKRDLRCEMAMSADANRQTEKEGVLRSRRTLNDSGMLPVMVVLALGAVLARVRLAIPVIGGISLGLSGGPLMVGLAVGHLGGIGSWSLHAPAQLLTGLRETGLMLFLAGAGASAGRGLLDTISTFGWLLFAGGAIVTVIPMIIGLALATRVFKLSLPDALGSICGGMTSTPALGALISAAGCDEVAAPYAATYPFALVLVTMASQLLAAALR